MLMSSMGHRHNSRCLSEELSGHLIQAICSRGIVKADTPTKSVVHNWCPYNCGTSPISLAWCHINVKPSYFTGCSIAYLSPLTHGICFNTKTIFLSMGIPIKKIRRSNDPDKIASLYWDSPHIMHIYALVDWVIIGSCNSLSTKQLPEPLMTLSIGPLGTNFTGGTGAGFSSGVGVTKPISSVPLFS